MIAYDQIAARAYEEYCRQVYVAERPMARWETLPSYVRRGWRAAIEKAIDVHAAAVST